MVGLIKLPKFRSSVFISALNVLSQKDQRKIGAVILIQIFMGMLDLLGVAAIGILGALAVSGVQSREPGNRVNQALELLNLQSYTFQEQAAVLGVIATVLLVGRTLISVLFTRKILFFLSRRGAQISATLVSKLLNQSLLTIQMRTSQEFLYSLTYGVSAITLGVVGTSVALVSDFSLLVIMTIGLFIVDPTIAFASLILFSGIGFAMYKLLHKRASELGTAEAKLSVTSNEKIVEVLNSYRESVVRNRRYYYAKQIGEIRLNLSETLAEISFLPSISKYVIEATVILAALLISATQFILQDAGHAVATLSVFLAAGTRIAPAVLRVQQGSISIKGALGTATSTLALIDELKGSKEVSPATDEVISTHIGFVPDVRLENATFSYPGSEKPAISDINIAIPAGAVVAIVGPSGAGKTTLVDILLGIIEPDSGLIKISEEKPLTAISKWPGAIAYVPQDVAIFNGTIIENIALGFPYSESNLSLVSSAIEIAQLREYISEIPDGLNSYVGERGSSLSGGQRQRLGIARALLTRPKLLVLDEATSSLDGQTESDISDAIQALKGSVTIVMIAHRLSTVRNADLVVYMESGIIKAIGDFEQVRNKIPNFDSQAKLMGL